MLQYSTSETGPHVVELDDLTLVSHVIENKEDIKSIFVSENKDVTKVKG